MVQDLVLSQGKETIRSSDGSRGRSTGMVEEMKAAQLSQRLELLVY